MFNIDNTALLTAAAAATELPKIQASTTQAAVRDEVSDTQAEVASLIIEAKADKARQNANRMSGATWHTDMIVSRLCDTAYDIRKLTSDFADIGLSVTQEQIGLTTVFTLRHYLTVGDAQDSASKSDVKRRTYHYALRSEVYTQGQHENGDPIKRVRLTAEQLGTVDRQSLALTDNAGMIKALESIARKVAALAAGKPKAKGLTAFELDVQAMFAAKGIALSDLLKERAERVAQFGIVESATRPTDTTPRIKA